jgi:hypothetical protein
VTALTRRSFAESLAVAALAPLIGVAPDTIRLAPWGGASSPAVPLGDEPGALAKALAQVIRTQYGTRLTDRDLASITRQIQTGLERVDQLRKVDLANGDEPDFVFDPSRRFQRPS